MISPEGLVKMLSAKNNAPTVIPDNWSLGQYVAPAVRLSKFSWRRPFANPRSRAKDYYRAMVERDQRLSQGRSAQASAINQAEWLWYYAGKCTQSDYEATVWAFRLESRVISGKRVAYSAFADELGYSSPRIPTPPERRGTSLAEPRI
jgi:hypothetical protein